MSNDNIREEFEAWLRSQQGIAYDGMWSFAWAAWQAARAQHVTTEAPADQHTTGLYRKFNVSRTDGRDLPGGDREGATYFVLDMTYDPYAKAALSSYAAACMDNYPQLASDLVQQYGLQPAQPVGEAVAKVVFQKISETDEYIQVDVFIDPINGYKPKEGDLLYTAPPTQVQDSDGARRIANLLNIFSKQFGKNDDAEGLLEFYGRTHYEQGVEDGSRNTPYGWQLVEQLADALRNVEEEMRLLSWQKSIELRRPAGSFGIAVKNDPLALEWQKVDAKLQALYAKRQAALAAAPQPKGGEHD